MSSSTSALKSGKSIIESYVSSSSEQSNVSSSSNRKGTNKSSSKNSIISTIFKLPQHPKFKWAVIAILLCICVFIYFRTQNKALKSKKGAGEKNKKEQLEDSRVNKSDKNERNALIDDINSLEDIDGEEFQKRLSSYNSSLMSQQLPQQFQASQHPQQVAQQRMQQQRMQQQRMQQQRAQQVPHQTSVQQRMQQVPQQVPEQVPEQVPQHAQEMLDTDSTDDVFIENENLMNHNLTLDEMNAIDRQLEDVNIDNINKD